MDLREELGTGRREERESIFYFPKNKRYNEHSPNTIIEHNNDSSKSKKYENLLNSYIDEELSEIVRGRQREPINSLEINNIFTNRELEELLLIPSDIRYENGRYDLLKDFVVKRDRAYFEEQARNMAGIPSRSLANALQDFQRGASIPQFGKSFLSSFVKQGQTLSEAEFRRYGLTLDIQQDASHYSRRFLSKYFDAPFNFCLTYDGKLIASIGFEPERGKMLITQIQGIKGNGDKLKPFKWERALLDYAVSWAEQNGVPEVAVQSVDNNKWAKYSFNALKSAGIYPKDASFEDAKRLDFEAERACKEAGQKAGAWNIHLMPHQGFMLYDVTAQRSGFKRDASGDYSRQIVSAEVLVDTRQILLQQVA